MIVSVHQPSYFPWFGLLDKIARSDLYILLDGVQLADRAFQHRNIFVDTQHRVKYLTVPIEKRGYRSKSIKEIKTCGTQWQKKHQEFLRLNYKNAPYFEQIHDKIKVLFARNYNYLIDILTDSMKTSFELLGITTPMVLQSDLAYERGARKSALIVSLVQTVGASVYLSGQGAKAYLDLEDFTTKNIKIQYNQFKHFVYPQQNASAEKFNEGLSCLDMFFNLGIDKSRALFWGNLGSVIDEELR